MNERYSRQSALVPTEKLAQRKVTVIGVGAIGRQVALQLAAMGVQHLQLIDDDTVEESNIASQGYYENNVGSSKVSCTGWACFEINSSMKIEQYKQKFNDEIEVGETVFCCVDSITARKEIWEAFFARRSQRIRHIGDIPDFFCDGRMATESLRILTAYDNESRKHYPTTLFSQEQAFQGSCTAKSTIYSANVISGIMIAQFAKYLRDVPIETDISFNLSTTELTILKE